MANLLDGESHTHTHTQAASRHHHKQQQQERQKEPRAKKTVVALAAAWPSTLQRAKCILISNLNANIIIIGLVYQNACPNNKNKTLGHLQMKQQILELFFKALHISIYTS